MRYLVKDAAFNINMLPEGTFAIRKITEAEADTWFQSWFQFSKDEVRDITTGAEVELKSGDECLIISWFVSLGKQAINEPREIQVRSEFRLLRVK